MPSKNTLTPYKVLSAINMATAGAQSSTPVNVMYMDDIAVQIIVSASSSPVGNLTIEASLDYAQTPFNPAAAGNWVVISTTALSADGSTLVQIQPQAVPWIRLTYTKGSGTGTLNAYISGKAI